jgi:DNA-binding response OmpR family regulator
MKHIVLVAEPDSQLRELYDMYLSECGYEVQIAADGRECARKLREVRPSVPLLDLELCWGGCPGVLAWLREETGVFGVPVVLTSTEDVGLEDIRAIRPPIVGILSKPFPMRILLERLDAAVPSGEREELFIRPANV